MYCFVIFQKGLRSVFDESSQTAWFFCTTFNIYHYIPTNSHRTLTNHIPAFSGRITLSIGGNRMNIRSVVLEFFVSRQTDRCGGGLCFKICIDMTSDPRSKRSYKNRISFRVSLRLPFINSYNMKSVFNFINPKFKHN